MGNCSLAKNLFKEDFVSDVCRWKRDWLESNENMFYFIIWAGSQIWEIASAASNYIYKYSKSVYSDHP